MNWNGKNMAQYFDHLAWIFYHLPPVWESCLFLCVLFQTNIVSFFPFGIKAKTFQTTLVWSNIVFRKINLLKMMWKLSERISAASDSQSANRTVSGHLSRFFFNAGYGYSVQKHSPLKPRNSLPECVNSFHIIEVNSSIKTIESLCTTSTITKHIVHYVIHCLRDLTHLRRVFLGFNSLRHSPPFINSHVNTGAPCYVTQMLLCLLIYM